MFVCNLRREQLLDLLPHGGEVAEIGVAEGHFSQEILARAMPSRLHLIDPWEHQDREDYQNDIYGNVAADVQDRRYTDVRTTFAAQIEAGRVVLDRNYSNNAVHHFADGQLDWVYLDGLHSFEGVAEDLAAYDAKVKNGGFIVGHDYTNHAPAERAGFGVVEAVNQFVSRRSYALVAITMENFPTYVIAKAPDSDTTQQLKLQILYRSTMLLDVSGYPEGFAFKHHALVIGDKQVVYPSFAAQPGSGRRAGGRRKAVAAGT